MDSYEFLTTIKEYTMKLSEFLKERKNARAEKFKQCMDLRKNKRITFYKLISEALKDSNYWEDVVEIRKGLLYIGGIRLTLNRDMSNAILETEYNRRLPRCEFQSIIDPQHVIGIDISFPTIRDPYMTITFSFISSLANNIDVDDLIESATKFFDDRIDELMEDPVESEDFDCEKLDDIIESKDVD